MQWLWVGILADGHLDKGSVHWRGWVCECMGHVLWEGVYTRGENFFKATIKIDQLKTTKSHMFNMSLKLTNHKCPATK